MGFVPEDFTVPEGLTAGTVSLAKLTAQHNERDYAAWTASMDHIKATPGFEDHPWPHPMTLAQNLSDLIRHEEDFERRTGFTYTVLIGVDVIGCVYIYPGSQPRSARVRSWVAAHHAELDTVLYHTVTQWLQERWPFATFEYARRP